MTDTVTAAPATARPRASRRRPEQKHAERRDQLAVSALVTLGELGYARTSLREIANNSEFSHGVVHYYFEDKLALIVYCVRYYKAQCITRYDAVVDDSRTPAELVDGFVAKLQETLLDEAPMHRLWYDLRTQAMFEEGLHEAVSLIDRALQEMVWRVVERYAELAGRPVSTTPAAAYGQLDGLFQQALLGHLTGRPEAVSDLVAQVRDLVPFLVSPAG